MEAVKLRSHQMNHMKLERRTIINGDLKIETQLRIGSEVGGEEPALLRIETPHLGSVPIIPSSTIRGFLRAEYQRMVKIINPSDSKHFVEMVFGSAETKNFRGFLKVSDLYAKNKLEMKTKPQVRINNKKRTAEKGGLFFVETIQPGSKFTFKLQIDNLDPQSDELRPFWYVLSEFARGNLPIGAMKSAGLGRVSLENLRIELYETPKQLLGLEPPILQDLSQLLGNSKKSSSLP